MFRLGESHSPMDEPSSMLWAKKTLHYLASLKMIERRWTSLVAVSSLLCVLCLVTYVNMGLFASRCKTHSILPFSPMGEVTNQRPIPPFLETTVRATPPQSPPPAIKATPSIAYFVTGTKGDLESMWRMLRALYHPRNQYVLHLDLKSTVADRLELARRVKDDPILFKMRNVHMITKPNTVTYRGPTMIANTLHACAILLRRSKTWDWFINLSASDYPLVTQDDILHVFSSLPRDLNFLDHTSRLGWKAPVRGKQLIIDPGLYSTNESDVFLVEPRRNLPSVFKLFTGSAWVALTREFVEFCVWGWDNLPRTLLMYYTNFMSSPEGYFHTVICNVPKYARTAVNHDLHFISWDTPPRQHPHSLGVQDFSRMLASNAAFARKFNNSDPVLTLIDEKLLGRMNDSLTPGGWCGGEPVCSEVGDISLLRPGPGANRLAQLMEKVVKSVSFTHHQCK
ncbi:beta-glucuronosyltransferase GlcAT14B-like [Wolffia australiana]